MQNVTALSSNNEDFNYGISQMLQIIFYSIATKVICIIGNPVESQFVPAEIPVIVLDCKARNYVDTCQEAVKLGCAVSVFSKAIDSHTT